MSVGSIIGGGIRLIRTQPQVVAVWAAIYIVVATVSMLVMQPFMASMMAAQRLAATNAAAGATPPAVFPGPGFGIITIVELAIFGLAIVAFAAVVRAVAYPTGDRFAYLRVGMDELRLLGLGILLVLIMLLAEIVATIAVIAIGAVFTAIGAGFVAVILGILLFCAVVYCQVRISLAGAMTVIEGRIVIKDAWRATKGRFWTLFGAYLVMLLAYFIVTVIIIAITTPQLFSAYSTLNPQAMQAAMQFQYASPGLSLTRILGLIFGAVLAVPMGVILCGGIATAAVEMSGVQRSIADEF